MVVRKISEFLPNAFHTTWRAALNQDILNVVEKGGRGSGKSSDISVWMSLSQSVRVLSVCLSLSFCVSLSQCVCVCLSVCVYFSVSFSGS